MPLTTDVNVVKQRAPSLIVATVRARKADKVTLLFGDDNELILERRRQAALPDADPVLQNVTIKKLIAIYTAIGDAPTVGMESRDGHPILVRRCSIER